MAAGQARLVLAVLLPLCLPHPRAMAHRALGAVAHEDDEALSIIVRAVSILLGLPDAESVVPLLRDAGEAAAQHPSEEVRRLGCRIMRAQLERAATLADAMELARALLQCTQVRAATSALACTNSALAAAHLSGAAALGSRGPDP
jgi:hypothetical protein